MADNIQDIPISQLTSKQKLDGGIYIVATPIGNMKDITIRALEILQNADLIVCEDTRVTNKLLSHYGIKKPMAIYNDHSLERDRRKIISKAESGEAVAVVSDAGTPLISDPGYKLVKDARERGVYVTCLPGASSVTSALVLSALPSDSFYFAGFLPTRSGSKENFMKEFLSIKTSLVFMDRNSRLESSIKVIDSVFSGAEISIIREITKTFEEARNGSAQELLSYYEKNGLPKGEIVIVVDTRKSEVFSEDNIDDMLHTLMENIPLKQAVDEVVQKTGKKKKIIYSRALEIKDS